LPSSGLFTPLFVPDRLAEALSDAAWLQAMLDAEGALARAGAQAAVVPLDAAEAIVAKCFAGHFDAAALGREGRAAGNPVPPLVRALTAAVQEDGGDDAAGYVHWGATSQDVLDTAAMLVARRALSLVVADLGGVAAACASLAREHRDTLIAGRTLLQQALPVTFGLKAAGWLVAVLDARRRLVAIRDDGLAVQLGGAAGTLASLGGAGETVLGAFAAELGLPEPVVPWHTARGRIGELAGALAVAAGALGKIARDVILLAQTEVGEAAEPGGGGRGGSSTLPHKRNPIGAVRAEACARRVPALAGVLLAAMPQEHERAAGAWHAEWEPLTEALALTGGAAAALREVVEQLEVHPARMRENLDATGGLLLAERVTMAVARQAGRLDAHAAVQAACERVAAGGEPLREELLAEPVVREHVAPAELDALLDPAGYLGAAGAFVDRALAAHEREGAR
jgi:3-carboxy-cis,cis-muconate cycloisomerase